MKNDNANLAMIGITLLALAQAGPDATLDRAQRDREAIEAAIDDADVPEQYYPVADPRSYTRRDVCAILKVAHPALRTRESSHQPRTGNLRSIPFVRQELRFSGPWGRCDVKSRWVPPFIHELLITSDGHRAVVAGGWLSGGECHLARSERSWRKVACFMTWVE